MRSAMLAALAAMVALTSGCATITKGTQQTVTVNTDPTGAICNLTRDAKPLAVVNPTPGSIPVEKGRGTIAIICKRDGYLEAAGTMASEFQAMTFGNILFGGLIGIAVDAASGAMHEYPSMVTITLIPELFDSDAARDAFFDKMKATLMQESKEVKERIEKSCREAQCASELSAADLATKAKLAEIDQKKLLARVKSSGG